MLAVSAALAAWIYWVVDEAFWSARREHLLLYAGFPTDSVASWFLVLTFLAGAAALLLLVPALIGRIQRKAPRRVIGWAAAVMAAAAAPYLGAVFVVACIGSAGIGDTVKVVGADGQSVLITQDGFDGDAVDIYTERDALHYKRVRDAAELSGWPRVKDRNCRLDTVHDGLQLTCGDKVLMVEPETGRITTLPEAVRHPAG